MSDCPGCGLPMSECQGPPICGLMYIANSPSREHGGFHENAIETAKQALRLIASLQAQVKGTP